MQVTFQSSSTILFLKRLPNQFSRVLLTCNIHSMPAQSDVYSDIKLRFNQKTEEIPIKTEKLITRIRSLYDDVATAKGNGFKAICGKLAYTEPLIENEYKSLTFLQNVSTSQEMRDACLAASDKLEEVGIEMAAREDVYEAYKSIDQADVPDDIGEYKGLQAENQRLLRNLKRDCRRSGLELPADKKKELETIQKEMSVLCNKFSKTCAEDNQAVYFTKEELEGLDEDFFNKRDKNVNGAYKVTCKYPDLVPVMSLCKNAETRKAMDLADSTKCESNQEIMVKVLNLRQDFAKLLNYPNYAEYILEVKMAKNVKTVDTFLSDLKTKLDVHVDKELQALKELKQKDFPTEKIENITINGWDYKYYDTLLMKTKYEVDDEVIKEYFPLENVTKVMFQIYENLLCLKIEEIPNLQKDYPDLSWSTEDCKLYRVTDTSDKGDGTLGYFWLDLFSRPGKFSQ